MSKNVLIITTSLRVNSNSDKLADAFAKAKENILHREDDADLIIEEMINGEQFGTEIHGTKGNYTILPPFKCRLNDQGVTDNLHYVKYGPILDEKYRVEELRSMLRRLAEEMGIEGCAQADLAFDGDKWVIIEVNPRMSGMTAAGAAVESRYPLEVVIESCLESTINYDVPEILEKCIYFRTMIHSSEELYQMKKEVHVKYMDKVLPDLGREDIKIIGATIALGGFATFTEMAAEVKRLAGKYPAVIDDKIVAYAEHIAKEQG